jgi:soluble lytic murein transglycosylase-like protein
VRGALVALAALFLLGPFVAEARADRLRLIDGTTVEVDEAWEDSQGVWYRRGGVTNLVPRSRVKAVERDAPPRTAEAAVAAGVPVMGDAAVTAGAPSANASDVVAAPVAASPEVVWIYLTGGARMEVDEATESAEGVWYRRGNISTFIERARVERVEREAPEPAAPTVAGVKAAPRERRWTTGRTSLDAIIRQNGARYGVDPYLIFLVMEHESHFNTRAVSPAGARGLMQLMPGTARRFGVRDPHNPAQSVAGGTRYLKELLKRFNNRVDLVLAGYNAGEGNVMRFGYRVPPFRETRNYVRRISARYR